MLIFSFCFSLVASSINFISLSSVLFMIFQLLYNCLYCIYEINKRNETKQLVITEIGIKKKKGQLRGWFDNNTKNSALHYNVYCYKTNQTHDLMLFFLDTIIDYNFCFLTMLCMALYNNDVAKIIVVGYHALLYFPSFRASGK